MRNLYLYLLLLLPFYTAGQGQQSITLSAPESGMKEHIARDFVKFLPGYQYTATGSNTMRAYVDEHILINTMYQSPPPTNRVLNQSYVVGTTAGAADVTPTGAATYQIPIAVPQGMGGVQPNLSIAYNSQAGNGLLGYGWNLAGLSAISRVGKTFYHDGKAEEVKLHNTDDNLMLDGQRLMLVSGYNLSSGAKYRTEIETFNDITCYGYGFSVKTRDGWTLWYGLTADALIEGDNYNPWYQHWLLYSVTDPSGNHMTYSYTKDKIAGEFRLKQIDYNYISQVPNSRVEFFYETRDDKQFAYIAGKKYQQNVLLKRIKASTTGTTFREYKLNYHYDGLYSKLTEVEEYGQNGERYNSVAIYWNGTTQVGYQYDINVVRGTSSTDYQRTHFGDFNGDGKIDFVSYPRNTGTGNMYLSNDLGSYTKLPNVLLNGYIDIIDIDGDGLNDVLLSKNVSGNLVSDSWQSAKSSFYQMGTFNSGKPYGEILVGDYDGDGRTEIVNVNNYGSVHKHVDKNSGWTQIATGGITDWGTSPTYGTPLRYRKYLQQFDMNGNGKTNILVANAYGGKVYELQGGFFEEICQTPYITHNDAPLIGDFNGDGLSDILIPNCLYMLISTGKGFERFYLSEPVMVGASQIYPINFNGDNITDIAILDNNSSNKITVKIGVFNGQKFNFTTYTTTIDYPGSYEYFDFQDIDGDGFSELICTYNPLKLTVVAFNNPENLIVKQIKDGLNNEINFTYSSLTQNSMYKETATPSFNSITGWNDLNFCHPIRWQPAAFNVVRSLKTYLGSHTETTSFTYSNIRTHAQGKGFLCFQQTEASYNVQNRKITTEYEYNPEYYNVSIKKQKTTDYYGNTDISTVTFSNSLLNMVANTKRIFPFVSSQVATDHLTGLITNVAYQYTLSDDGNPWKITETRGNLVTETVNTWAAKGSTFKNRLTKSVVTRKGLQGMFTETTGFDYDNSGRLTEKIDFQGTAKAVTTTYTGYHTTGSPENITTTANGLPTISTTLTYDSYGRLKTKTDATGTSATDYDLFGRVISQTGIDGLTVSYQYDGFGNLVKETNPTGNVVYARVWDIGTGINSNQLYRIDRTETGAPLQSVWYNYLGQEIKSRTKGFGGDVFTINDYNYYYGRLHRVYVPSYGNSGSQYTQYGHDAFGRLSTEVSSIAGNTTYSYNGLTTTVTYPDGTFQTTVLNSSGLVESVTDGGGTITYTYNSLGKPVTTTAVGLTTAMRYDYRGYQIALKDPNMNDTIRYDYDAYGMLRSQTNARGQTTNYTYDAAGRVDTEIRPEMNLTYHYATSGAGKGQLESIKSGSNELRKIVYNSLGLPKQVSEKIDNVNFITNYTYDSYGRLSQKESPSGFKLAHVYNSDGYLTHLRDANANADIWQVSAVNAFGQVTESTLGNGLTRVTAYKSSDLTLQSITLKNGSITPPMDEIVYDFTPSSGNLQQRNDKTNSRNEVFGYDNVNRLNSMKMNTAAAQSITYYSNGNINTKFDVGTYQYANNNHAVSGISPLAVGYTPPAISVTHASFERPTSVALGNENINYGYSPDKQRNTSKYFVNNVLQSTRYYNGTYEKEVTGSTTKEYDYVYSPEGLAAIIVTTGGASVKYYAHTDHLGSLRTLTDGTKSVISKYHYDAWGKRTLVSGSHITNRGFTMHEHLENIGLINMNARLYDPVIGRFLAPDPYVQMPDYTQSYNRYSYAINNPLIYTDPDGEFFFAAVGIGILLNAACWGAVINAAAYTVGIALSNGGFDNWSWSDFGKSAGIGAISGFATAQIGQAFGAVGSAGFSGEIGRAYVHGITNGMISGISGGNYWSGFAAGSLGSLAGSAYMMSAPSFANTTLGTYAFSGLAGGVGAAATGGDFWKGAGIGLMNAGLNHVQQGFEEHQFFNRLRNHYESGTGDDFKINTSEFRYLIKKGRIDFANAKELDNGYYSATIDFYNSNNDLKFSFGKATVTYRIGGVGMSNRLKNNYIYSNFYDRYDFDPKPWGTRTVPNEVITRGYGWYSKGTPFDIYYRKP